MQPVTRFTFLAFQLNGLIDDGHRLPIDETRQQITDGTVLDWVEGKHTLDLSIYADDDRHHVLELFAALENTVDSDRKMWVSREGLCLLVAYCLEGAQQDGAALRR